MPRKALALPRSSDGRRVLWHKIEGFAAFVAELAGLTNQEAVEEIRRRFGVDASIESVANMRRRHMAHESPDARRRAYDKRPRASKESPPPSFVRELGPKDEGYFVTVSGDCLITSDWHIPHHREPLLERLFQVAKAYKISTLICAGDLLNEDAFSKWKWHRFNVPWAEEKYLARNVLKRIFEVFDEFVYILDNHDRRIIAANEKPSEFTESDVIELLTWGVKTKKLRPSVDYTYVIINGTWRLTCPREYRRVKLSLPGRLAQLHHQNIIVGGDHLFGLGMDDSGKFVIANSMCMIDPARAPYANISDSTFPRWTPGFWMIRNNRLAAFPDAPQITDWDEVIRIGHLLTHRDAK